MVTVEAERGGPRGISRRWIALVVEQKSQKRHKFLGWNVAKWIIVYDRVATSATWRNQYQVSLPLQLPVKEDKHTKWRTQSADTSALS